MLPMLHIIMSDPQVRRKSTNELTTSMYRSCPWEGMPIDEKMVFLIPSDTF